MEYSVILSGGRKDKGCSDLVFLRKMILRSYMHEVINSARILKPGEVQEAKAIAIMEVKIKGRRRATLCGYLIFEAGKKDVWWTGMSFRKCKRVRTEYDKDYVMARNFINCMGFKIHEWKDVIEARYEMELWEKLNEIANTNNLFGYSNPFRFINEDTIVEYNY